MTARPVHLGVAADLDPAGAARARALAHEATTARDDAAARLDLAARWGGRLPAPGGGQTRERWELLATAGAADLGVARTLEPHADALAILAEAGLPAPPADTTWGVWAAEGRGVRVTAAERDGRWLLDGVKSWCSLADQVSHALVTAWVGDDVRGLFAVAMTEPGATPDPEAGWVSRGLREIVSGSVTFQAGPAEPVGGPGWYLRRDGFAWGGVGVAAVWFGATVALVRRLRRAGRERTLDQIGQAHLGAADLALTGARATLAESAVEIDAGRAAGEAGELLALRVRGVVAESAERVLSVVDHALGPAPLTQEEEHARRVADLRVYVRQQHAERDAARLGGLVQGAPDDGLV